MTSESTSKRAERRLEIVATVLLSLSAVATVWSSYQASLWDGKQSSNYSRASALRTRASQSHLEANQWRIADLIVVESYLNASASGETALAEFYRTRMREELKPAFEAWLALGPATNPNAPLSPMRVPEYRLASDEEAGARTAEADAAFEQGEHDNNISDTYVATTLFFAAVLFFAGISERFSYLPARTFLLALASVGLVAGLIVAIAQPVTTG